MKLLAANNINLEGALEGTNFAAVGGYSVPNIISTGIQLLLITAAVGAFIYLLMGAFAWITSGGNKENVENARKKITGALVGLAIVFSVYVLQSIVGIVFLGDGNAIFNFKIPTLDKIPFNPQNNNQGSGGDGGTSDTNQTLLKKCGGAVSLNQKSLYGKIGSICSKCISIDTMCNNKYGRFGDYATSIEAKAKEGDTGFYCAVAWLNPKEPASKCD